MLEVKGIVGKVFKNTATTYAISIKKAVVDMGILEPGKEYLITEIQEVGENKKIEKKNEQTVIIPRNQIFSACIPNFSENWGIGI